MNNIYKKIKLHPFFYISLLFIVLTGQFKNFILFMSIILFHEIGHILIGFLLKWKIEQIIILPFGCITVFNECINKRLIEEFVVCIAGPIFQIIYYLIMSNFFDITNIHNKLLFFNLLPIIPLDGSKIFNLIINKIFSFYYSQIITVVVSFLLIFLGMYIVLINNWNLILFLSFSLMFIKTLRELKNINYIFNKFLLERYIRPLNIKKIKNIKGLNLKKMYRNYRHIFITKNKSYTEREIIRKKFDLQEKI